MFRIPSKLKRSHASLPMMNGICRGRRAASARAVAGAVLIAGRGRTRFDRRTSCAWRRIALSLPRLIASFTNEIKIDNHQDLRAAQRAVARRETMDGWRIETP